MQSWSFWVVKFIFLVICTQCLSYLLTLLNEGLLDTNACISSRNGTILFLSCFTLKNGVLPVDTLLMIAPRCFNCVKLAPFIMSCLSLGFFALYKAEIKREWSFVDCFGFPILDAILMSREVRQRWTLIHKLYLNCLLPIAAIRSNWFQIE